MKKVFVQMFFSDLLRKTIRNKKLILTLIFSPLALALHSCGSGDYIAKDISMSGKNWTVNINEMWYSSSYATKLTAIQQTGYHYEPDEGKIFIILEADIKNNTVEDRSFFFNNFKIVSGDSAYMPFLIINNTFLGQIKASANPNMSAEEEIRRIVLFSVPSSLTPQKVIYEKDCEVEIPQKPQEVETEKEEKVNTEW